MPTPIYGIGCGSTSTPDTSSASYCPLQTSKGIRFNTTETTDTSDVVATAGIISNLYVKLTNAPNTGKSWVVALRVNGVTTTLTCTIADGATTGSDVAHTISVAAGDKVGYIWTPSSTPDASGAVYVSSLFSGTASNESITVAGTGTATPGTGSTSYIGLCGKDNSGTTEAQHNTIVPTAGTFTKLYVEVSVAPGVGKSWAFTLMKNGSATGITCTIADTATAANDTAHTATCVATDKIYLKAVPSGTPASATMKYGTCFVPTVSGESIISSIVLGSGISAAGTTYGYLVGGATNDFTATEAQHGYLSQPKVIVKNIYIDLDTAPGASKSWQFALREAGSTSAITATVSDAATTATTSANVQLSANEVLNLISVPTGTPTDPGYARIAMTSSLASITGQMFQLFE